MFGATSPPIFVANRWVVNVAYACGGLVFEYTRALYALLA